MSKANWLHVAEVFDSWRVIPRIVLFGYSAFVWQITEEVLHWYFAQPANERGLEESGVVGVVFTAVTGFAPWIFRIYMSTGRKWNDHPVREEDP